MSALSPPRVVLPDDVEANPDVADFPVSPELVLVDPELARRARARLPVPVEPPPRRPAPTRVSPVTPDREEASPPVVSEEQGLSRPASRRRRVSRRLLAAVAVVVAAAVGATLFVRHDARTTPRSTSAARPAVAASAPVKAGTQATPRPKTRRQARQSRTTPSRAAPTSRSTAPRPKSRRASPKRAVAPTARSTALPAFSWVAIPKATYYDFALFRGDEKIFADRTRTARLAVPSTWRYAGRSFRLSRGTYRWVVRPAFGRASASRLGTAIVNARLVVR